MIDTEDRNASKGRWAPLLKGELAQKSWEAVWGIAEDLASPAGVGGRDGTIASGAAGIALFYTYLALADPQGGWENRTFEHLAWSMESIEKGLSRPSLLCGFPGIAWTVDHIQGLLSEDQEDRNSEIDAALVEFLGPGRDHRNYDLIYGLVGLGCYGLSRFPKSSGREIAERVVDLLDQSKLETPQGFTWHTHPDLLPPWQREISPEGYLNLGLAHGVPGVIAMLGWAHRLGVARPRVEALLEGAMTWLLAQQHPMGMASRFPTLLKTGIEATPTETRLAWCYGDLGVAAALLHAARNAGRPDWEAEAIQVASQAAGRPREDSGVVDASLCHGAAGNAHIFNRLFQRTGVPAFETAALGWYEHALELRQPGSGVGGFRAFRPSEAPDAQVWHDDPDFLDGATGIGLALLAGLTGDLPAWDQVLLLDIPIPCDTSQGDSGADGEPAGLAARGSGSGPSF